MGYVGVQTKHFLLIGFLGMFIGSIVFCFLSFKKKENKMHVRLWLALRCMPETAGAGLQCFLWWESHSCSL